MYSETDLRLKYKSETGNTHDEYISIHDYHNGIAYTRDYVEWLEEQLINIQKEKELQAEYLTNMSITHNPDNYDNMWVGAYKWDNYSAEDLDSLRAKYEIYGEVEDHNKHDIK